MPIASNSAAIAAPVPQIHLYLEQLKATRDLEFAHYDDLHRWSVTDLEGFWRSIWDYDRIESRTPFSAMLGADTMPGARWCEGAEVSYARHVFRHAAAADSAGQPAIVAVNERGSTEPSVGPSSSGRAPHWPWNCAGAGWGGAIALRLTFPI